MNAANEAMAGEWSPLFSHLFERLFLLLPVVANEPEILLHDDTS